MKRGGRLRSVSVKRRRQLAERQSVVARVLVRDGYRCQAPIRYSEHLAARCCRPDVFPVTCGGPLDAHEVIPRSAWAAGWLVVDNVVTVCRRHHDWIGDHPAAAELLGLHGYSWQVP